MPNGVWDIDVRTLLLNEELEQLGMLPRCGLPHRRNVELSPRVNIHTGRKQFFDLIQVSLPGGFHKFPLGLSILLGSLITFAFPVALWVILNGLYIPSEEELLEKTFGEEYLRYKQRVRRWV